MRSFSQSTSKIAGFTLIELMIALAIASFLIAGVFKVYTNGRVAQGAIEIQTQLIDDGRFALRTLSYDLRHAGLWGRTNNDDQIARALGTETSARPPELGEDLPALPSDCYAGWYHDLNKSFFVSENINPYSDTCIPSDHYQPNTDVLVVKYASPTPVVDAVLTNTVVYAYTNHFYGELFVGPNAPQFSRDLPGMVPQNYRLKARAYFVNKFTDFDGDDYPSLHRVELATGPSISNQMLIPGVENLQVQLGWDKDGDEEKSVEMYIDGNSDLITGEANKLNLSQVKSVQFWVLLRSRRIELLPGESQYISMAGRAPVEYADGFRRVVMSSVVRLQNRMHKTKAAGE